MSVRQKTLLIAALTVIGLLLVLSLTLRSIIIRDFAGFERQMVSRNVGRALNALADDLTAISSTAHDWSAWDDTYAFIQDHNPEYIESNLGDTTLPPLRLNFMVFVDTSGRIVAEKACDLQTGETVPVPESLRELVSANGPLVQHQDPLSGVSGFVLLPESPALVVSWPIVTTDHEGPIAGSLVLGRFLNEAEIARLSDRTRVAIDVYRSGEGELPADVTQALGALAQPGETAMVALSDSEIAGYALLQDVYGRPSLVLRAVLPRDVHARGESLMRYFLAAILAVGLVLVAANYALLDRAVISRLFRLSASLKEIAARRDASARVSLPGRDELSALAQNVNEMLAALARAEAGVRESERRFRELADLLPQTVFEADGRGRITFANQTGLETFGYTAEDVANGVHVLATIVPGDRDAARARMGELLNGKVGRGNEYTALRRDGTTFPVVIHASPVERAGRVVGFRGIIVDISDRKLAEERLRESNEFNTSLLRNSPSPIVVIAPDTTVQHVNPAFEELTGFSADEVTGRKAPYPWWPEDQADKILGDFRHAWGKGRRNVEEVLQKKNGDRFWVQITLTPILSDGKLRYHLSSWVDITARKQAEEAMRHRAYYDALTDLPNRLLLEDRMAVALAEAARAGRVVGVLFLDVDRFKLVNDTFGHAFGDQLLREVATRLKQCLRAADTVARLGGDEFAVLLPEIQSAPDAAAVAGKLIHAVTLPMNLEGHELSTSVSVGISLYPNNGNDARVLLQKADAALYEAKERGRNRFEFYSGGLEGESGRRLALENDLRQVLRREELVLHYQPQVEIATGRIIAIEALLRWRHPTRGLLAPADFIEVAEEAGLIEQIGEWVLRQACAQATRWHRGAGGAPVPRVAVNLSARELHREGLPEIVDLALAEADLEAHLLELEISENAVTRNIEASLAVMRELKQRGVHLTLDDFGLGHSSLIHMKLLPVDALKIDQSFIRDLVTDANDRAIVEAVIAMARALNLRIIAEGVETEDQLEFLRAHHCYAMQGYLHSRPVPPGALGDLLRSHRQSSWLAPSHSSHS